jgi:hypothetical protein
MDRRKRICICGHPITVHSQEGTCRLSDCPCLNFRFQRTADAPVTQIAKNALAALAEAGECCIVCGKSLASGCDCGKTEAGEGEK